MAESHEQSVLYSSSTVPFEELATYSDAPLFVAQCVALRTLVRYPVRLRHFVAEMLRPPTPPFLSPFFFFFSRQDDPARRCTTWWGAASPCHTALF